MALRRTHQNHSGSSRQCRELRQQTQTTSDCFPESGLVVAVGQPQQYKCFSQVTVTSSASNSVVPSHVRSGEHLKLANGRRKSPDIAMQMTNTWNPIIV